MSRGRFARGVPHVHPCRLAPACGTPTALGSSLLLGILAIVGSPAVLAGCDRSSPEVIAYVAVDEHAARPVFERFTERTGIRVRALFDSEINKTTGLAQRLRSERAAPRADLFWSGESVQAGRLASEGVLEGGSNGALATMLRARVLVYDPARVKAAELPSSWWDLAEQRYRDRVVMADPRFGSTSGHIAAMYAWCEARGEQARFESWARGLERNRVKRLSSGNAGVVRAVASGEADFGMTDSDDVAAHMARSGAKPLASLALKHGAGPGEGPWLIMGVAAVVAGAPHRELAEQLLAFLASDEAQSLLAAAAPGFHPVESAAQLGWVDGLHVQPDRVERALPSALELLLAPAQP